jgi:hypothetical protein
MENELYIYKTDDFKIPCHTMKVMKQVFPGLRNMFERIREYQNLADDIYIPYLNTFVDYVTMKLQKHISEKIGKKKKPGNSSKTFPDL